MANLFCPKCGNDTDIFYDRVCRQCFIGNKKLVECPQVIYSRICPTCNSVFKRGKWSSSLDESQTIIDCVKDKIRINQEATNIEINFEPTLIDYSRYRVHLQAKAMMKGAPMEASFDIEVRISWETCDTCSRISGGYFEGIVQIRADKRVPAQDELKKCIKIADDVAERSREKGDRLAFIAKKQELDEGIDLYVGSTKLGKQVCRALIDEFGGKFSESPKLVGQKNGEDLYRITYALRLPEFIRGDIISVDDKVIEVLSCGKHVSGIDLETGKKFMENFNDLMQVKKLSRRSDAVSAILVADEGRTIQVMDPETYVSVNLKRPEFLSAEPGTEVKIIKTPKGLFVMP